MFHFSQTINKISFTQLYPNHYQISVIQYSSAEHRYPGYTDGRTVNLPLALISILKGYSIFTPYFIIPTINSFTSKMHISLWGYQFHPFRNLSNQLFNFEIMPDFKLANITKVNSHFILSMLPPIADVSIVNFMQNLNEINKK